MGILCSVSIDYIICLVEINLIQCSLLRIALGCCAVCGHVATWFSRQVTSPIRVLHVAWKGCQAGETMRESRNEDMTRG